MRLKKIKPGMVIHCKTEEEAKKLIEESYKQGYEWNGNGSVDDTFWNYYEKMCYRFENDIKITYERLEYFIDEYGANRITEFTDLIEPELSAEEVLQIISEICTGRRCTDCPIGTENCITNKLSDKHRVVEICQQWKSEHEKKEPEVEWVYRVFGAENFGEKFFDTEEEAIERCEELAKSQKTKKYARYEKVCRVKAV